MSQLSEKVRTAIYTKLNVASVKNKATGGVWADEAPASANLPYVIFARVPGTVNRTFTRVSHETDRWMIKAYADKTSSGAQSPQALAEEILVLCETTIGESLEIAGHEVWKAWRVADMPPMDEFAGDRTIYGRGFFLEVTAR